MSKHSARGPEWERQRKRVLVRDGDRCTACGAEEDLSVDHVMPISLQPDHDYADHELVTLCRRCNSIKSDRVLVRLDYRSPRWFS